MYFTDTKGEYLLRSDQSGAILEECVDSIMDYSGLRTLFSGRWLSVSLIVLTALPWSLALGVTGVWLIARFDQGLIGGAMTTLSSGVAALSASQIVFLMCIADRLFPQAHKALSRTVEGGLGLIFLISVCVLALSAMMGW